MRAISAADAVFALLGRERGGTRWEPDGNQMEPDGKAKFRTGGIACNRLCLSRFVPVPCPALSRVD